MSKLELPFYNLLTRRPFKKVSFKKDKGEHMNWGEIMAIMNGLRLMMGLQLMKKA